MQEMRQLSIEAYKWLNDIPPQTWTRSHFTGRAHSDLLLNNLCEVFNKELRDARDKPIITALDYVREYLMKRIVNVQRVIDKSEGPLTPAATRLFNDIKNEATQYSVVWNGGSQYQVSGPWGDQCVVDVTQRVCSCRKWELTGMPCKHVVRAIRDMADNRLNPGPEVSWVHPCYWLETWKDVYSHKINPIDGRKMWVKSKASITITAPKHHNPVGRPKKKRRRGQDEQEEMVKGGKLSRRFKSVQCGTCGNFGHNKTTCKGQSDGSSSSRGGSNGIRGGRGGSVARGGASRGQSGARGGARGGSVARGGSRARGGSVARGGGRASRGGRGQMGGGIGQMGGGIGQMGGGIGQMGGGIGQMGGGIGQMGDGIGQMGGGSSSMGGGRGQMGGGRGQMGGGGQMGGSAGLVFRGGGVFRSGGGGSNTNGFGYNYWMGDNNLGSQQSGVTQRSSQQSSQADAGSQCDKGKNVMQ